MNYKELLENRYAVKKFDGKEVPEEKLNELLEHARLAASSFGLQPFKVVVVKDNETKQKLQEASWNQSQVGTSSHVLVFCAYTDWDSRVNGYEKLMREQGIPAEKVDAYTGMMRGYLSKMSEEEVIAWAKNQAYIAMANVLNGAVELGFHSCPMEGFSSEEYSKILNLPNDLVPVVVVPVGYPADVAKPKTRYSNEELFIFQD